MKKFNLHLYLVTDEASKCRYSLLETVRKAADGGVTMVQYRSTNPDAGTCYREALPIRDFLASAVFPSSSTTALTWLWRWKQTASTSARGIFRFPPSEP